MEQLKRWLLILLTSSLLLILLITAMTILPVFAQGPGGMMHGFGFNNGQSDGYGPGWMGRGRMMGGYDYNNAGGYGPGRMWGYTQGYSSTTPSGFGSGWMHGGFNPRGMMGGGFAPRWGYTQEEGGPPTYGYSCPGMGGGGRWGSNSPFFDGEPLSMDAAAEAVNSFLAELDDANLEVGEVMIFDNHAYAQIVEKDSGIGAMEVLVDPSTKTIYPEMGPNMMWNVKYGMTLAPARSAGVVGYGPSDRFGWQANEPSAEMPVSPNEAVRAAQTYLDAYGDDGLTVDEHADQFYGYYTLHVNRDGEIIGMLSVNGFTGQVFLHTWHGELLEMSDE
jgi:hypothetical protein